MIVDCFFLSDGGVTSYLSMQSAVATVWQSRKPPPSPDCFHFTVLIVETLSYFAVKTA